MFKNKLAFVLLCLVLILSACGSSDETTTENKGSSEGKAVKLTFTEPARLLSVAPLYVAIEQGFFEKEGIDAEIVSGGGGAQVIASVLSGEAQFAVSGPRSMFTPLDKGEDLLAIQSLNSALTYQITLSNQYLKKKNVSKDSSFEDKVASLNGATIGTNLVGDSGDVYTRYLMQMHGVDPNTLKAVKLAGDGSKIGGMQEGVVDGGIASPPMGLQAESKDVGEIVINTSEEPMYGNMVWEAVFAKKEYLEENHETSLKVVRAIGKGMEFTRNHPREAAESIVSYFDGIDVDILEESIIGLKNTFKGYGEMNQEAWDNAQDPLVEFGKLSGVSTKQDTTEDVIWTNSYIEEAFKK
ncbi:ABC-type nitrate/sulfonate/bicarbonate transport system, substrate-binding protein [Peribacillus simplex]|uniref:ABC-type nitrate/sulfonate/bicarbonate transport system, substrate-binding protein n=1 Tax=Peribacillus simplex TaxID=1478 RepID=A0A9X8RAB4_9BACI|nr:ABC transporter substrate-binding protein [Peribacillus simplex]SIR56100.1 ABC-type nitrate/sulfonate/bicarbonate transport system, substrate-binding protein [Peribacillus simplex]